MGGGAERTMINNKASDQDKQKVPFYKLFLFADKYDIALMIVGSLCAIGNGLSQPLMTLVFGGLINTFGATDPANIVPMVSKVCMYPALQCKCTSPVCYALQFSLK
jgi:ATP-binding cassette subfamily B (MDR/TAP) protein 1